LPGVEVTATTPDPAKEFLLVKENSMTRTRAKARDYMHALTLSQACSRGL
jgi:hypothetical protein